MNRYIDADALMKELQEEIDFETSMYTEEQNEYFNMGLKCAIRDVKSQPLADVVEVVRCRDCKHCFEKNAVGVSLLYCALNSHYTLETNFCSYGERKEQCEKD